MKPARASVVPTYVKDAALRSLSLLLGAAMLAPGAASAGESVLIRGVPHVEQKPDFCGEACVESVLAFGGSALTQDDVFEAGAIDPALGRGLWTKELKRAVERLGFAPGRVWYRARSKAEVLEQWEHVLADLSRGVPSILCMHYDDRPDTTEHFRLILGYDAKTREVIFHEPAAADGAYRRMPLAKLVELWPLKYDAESWTVIRLRLARGPSATYQPSTARHRPADYAQHVLALKERTALPSGFTIRIEPPFVVLGDEAPELVQRRAKGTVRFAVDKLKQDYFSKDPDAILDVWLFRDRDSYEKNTRALFGATPDTPYGYYAPRHGALVMNIATGGGTLVHEIVHPFMEANFPDCPPWLNEGLGSLYEQSGEENGRIRGYTNWRLSGLQAAIRHDEVPTFRALTAMNDEAFYDDDTGTHYAAARYLLYYLQEEGLLVRYYHAFHAARRRDPTGYVTLMKTLGEDDMRSFEHRWAKWVLGLRFGD